MATETIPQIPVTATTIGAADLFELWQSGASAQIAWSSILGQAQTWTGVQTFVAPVLGLATATSINKVAITAPASSATLTIANGATLTCSATATVSGTNSGDQTITLTGDATGSGTGSFATTLATVNANVGSFTSANITVNAKGLITAAANGSGGGGGSGTVTSVATDSTLIGGPITVTGTLGINLANANIWTAAQTLTLTGTTNTKSDAVVVSALGAATATGTQFYSGAIHLTCSAWGSTAPAAQLNDWQIYTLPVAGTTTTSSVLRFDNQTNAGGYFLNFGIVSTSSGNGAVLIGNKSGAGALWLGTTSLTTAATPVLLSTGTTLALSSPSTSVLNIQNFGATIIQIQTVGITSSAGAVWNSFNIPAITCTLSGSTNITTAGGLNLATINAPTISAASALTVTNSATLAITGPPTGAGAGPATITTAYTLWLQGGNFGQAGITSLYNNVATKGTGQPAIYGLDNRTGLTTADGSPITLYTSTGVNQIYRISTDIFATAAVTGTANYTLTWTENSTTQTAVVSATAINVIGTSTQIIRPDSATAITAQLTGTFTGTFSVVGIVERIA